MNHTSTKAAAEAALLELPSVMGAFVREDINGSPREIHLLIQAGPDAGDLARDIRELLEERLGVPIDQRVISIAQVDPVYRKVSDVSAIAGPRERTTALVLRPHARAVFRGIESVVDGGRVRVNVRLQWAGETHAGEGDELESANGRARAASAATLRAAMAAAWENLRLDLDLVSVVQAVDRSFVLVSVLALSPAFGRRPLSLVGIQPVDADIESAAALATLKAVNRVLSLTLPPQ
ncbi:MAG: hypothetical protein P8099_00575 [Gemmatimonadota bacterium]|jgi:hypothetical protein